MAGNGDKLMFIRGTFQGSEPQFPVGPGGANFTVCFNPSEYTVAKRTGYAEAAVPGLDAPIIQFSKGEAQTLSIELLLDTCTYDNSQDVRTQYLDKLESFLMVDSELHAPPPCKVVWGSLEFVGLFENLSRRFVMFLDDGTPVRVRATISLKEYVSVSSQLRQTPRNSPDRDKIHQFKLGDSLWQLAYHAYGDPDCWRQLADANAVDNPRAVAPGTPIKIPPLKRSAGIFANDDEPG